MSSSLPVKSCFCCCSAVRGNLLSARPLSHDDNYGHGRTSAEYWRDPRLDGGVGNVGHTVLAAAATTTTRQTAASFKFGAAAGLLLSPLHRRPGARDFTVPAAHYQSLLSFSTVRQHVVVAVGSVEFPYSILVV